MSKLTAKIVDRTKAEYEAIKDRLEEDELTRFTDAGVNEPTFALGTSKIATEASVTAAVASSLSKYTIPGVGAQALTYTNVNGTEVHAESGVTSVTMAQTDFSVSGSPVTGSFWLFNYTGSPLPVTISGFSGGISEDGDVSNDTAGTGALVTVPHAKKALIIFDVDGFVRATLLGVEVTQTELDTGLAGKLSTTAGAVGATNIADNAVTDGKIRDSAARSVIGRASNTTGDTADIVATNNSGAVLRESAGNIGFGQIGNAALLDQAVTHAKMQNMAANTVMGNATASATTVTDIAIGANQVIGRKSTGNLAVQSVTDAAWSLLDDADAATMRTTLGASPLASPTFTGTPTAPTAAPGTNTTQIATTAYVLANSADTVINNTLTSTSITEALSAAQGKTLQDGKAPLASPTFIGVPVVPTAALGTNTTQVASTAFVQAEIAADLATATPLVNGTAAVGTSVKMAREDHVHPSDTSRQAKFTYTTTQDANNLITGGVHVSDNGAGSLTNGPSGNSAWSVVVSSMTSGANTYIHQLFSTDNNDMYTRKRDNATTWSTWTKVLNGTVAQSDVTNLVTDLAAKQATLVSGTNIKTVNSQSIVGAGNLVVATGSSLQTHTWDAVTDNMANRTVHLRANELTATGALATWAAAGGTSVNGTQGITADQPSVVLNDLNGFATADFTGLTDRMSVGTLSTGTACTVIAVVEQGTQNINGNAILARASSAVDTVCFTTSGGPTSLADGKMYGLHDGVTWMSGSNTAVPSGWNVLSYVWDSAADLMSYFTNGGANGTATYTGAPTTSGDYHIGGRAELSGAGIRGSIAEVLVFAGVALSATERTKAEGYLAWKYALQANLPSGHTYKNAAPTVVDIPIYANNAAAITGSLAIGSIYRSGADPDVLSVVH